MEFTHSSLYMQYQRKRETLKRKQQNKELRPIGDNIPMTCTRAAKLTTSQSLYRQQLINVAQRQASSFSLGADAPEQPKTGV